MIEIKHKITGDVILSLDCDSLIEADLRGADLIEADLRGADLSGANLSEADLRGADLSGANLSEADLREADLSGANLSWADLREANLREANLREADLRGGVGSFSLFYGGKHHGWATCSHIGVGCQMHTHADWREQYATIGADAGYTPDEIERYRQWIFSLDWMIEK